VNKQVIERAIEALNDFNKCVKAKADGAYETNDFVKARELVIPALEKQMPKKPEFYGDSEDGKLLCPSCNEDLWDVRECGYNGCPYCLQAIDWRNEDE